MCFSAFKKFTDFLFDFWRPVTFNCLCRGEKTPACRDWNTDWTFDLENLLSEIFEDDFVASTNKCGWEGVEILIFFLVSFAEVFEIFENTIEFGVTFIKIFFNTLHWN